jgi:hypothetical protein
MEVSMDGVRKRLVADYNSLTKKLNNGYDRKDDIITVDPIDVMREMEGLRNGIVTLAFSYMEGEGGFKELPENTHFENFMPEEE